jgi:hypothetical protein
LFFHAYPVLHPYGLYPLALAMRAAPDDVQLMGASNFCVVENRVYSAPNPTESVANESIQEGLITFFTASTKADVRREKK